MAIEETQLSKRAALFLDALEEEVTPDRVRLAADIASKRILGKGRDAWYQDTYEFILRSFSDQGNSPDKWILRKSLVFTWIMGVPSSGLDGERASKMDAHEAKLSGLTLGGPGLSITEERLSHPSVEIDLRNLLADGSAFLNSPDRGAETVATTSKLLHFMNPALFPLLDSQVKKTLKKNGAEDAPPNERFTEYIDYMAAMNLFIRTHSDVLASRNDGCTLSEWVTPVRLIDLCLFRSQANSKL